MSNKIKFLVKNSLKKRFKSKWFLAVNIVLLVLIPLIANIDTIIKFFGGEFNKPTTIYVVDNADAYETFSNIYISSDISSLINSQVNIEKYEENIDELSKTIAAEERKDIILIINPDKSNVLTANFITYDLVDTVLYQAVMSTLNATKQTIALEKSNISQDALSKILTDISVERTILNEEASADSEMMHLIGGVLIPIFVLPFFFLIILVVQYVGAEINEEKISKSMEIIISSISPMAHFISKIISTNVFVITQGFLLLVYGAVGIFSRVLVSGQNFIASFGGNAESMFMAFSESGMLVNIVKAIPFTIILILLSFIAYSLIAGILASITTSIEDYQQIQTPIMLVLAFAYYLGIMASTFDASILIRIVSYIPLVSSILTPVLLVQGQIALVDVLISLGLLIALILLLLKYGIKVYKVGILNYSSKKLWSKMGKAIKNK